MAKKYQFLLELKEKVLAPVKKINQSFGDATKNANKVNEAMDKINSKANVLKTSFSSLNKKMGGLPVAIAGVFAVNKITEFGGAVVDTLSAFERFEAVLTNTLGSNSAAKKALSEITKFASQTPFQVDELSSSFVKLANQNFKPTMAEMTQLGDLAAAVGSDFGQLTDAVISGRVMEFESLKTFGVTAKKEGDKIAFGFKGQTTVVKASSQAVTDYVLSLGKLKGVQGSMAAVSETTGGKLSNLSDKFTQLKLQIGQALKPVISATIGLLSVFLEKISKMVTWIRANSESIKFWAKTFVVLTGAVLGFVAAMNASLIAATIITAITMPLVILRNTIIAVRTATLLFSAALMANPIGALIATIAALVGAFIGLKAVFPEVYNSIKEWFGKAYDYVYDIFIKPIMEAFNTIKSYLGFGGEESVDPVNSKTVEDLKAVANNLKSVGSGISDATDKVNGLKSFGVNIGGVMAPKIPSSIKPKISTPKLSANKDSMVTQGVSQVVGESKEGKVINVTIDSLVKVLNVYATSAKERGGDVKREMEKVFLELSNNINHAS